MSTNPALPREYPSDYPAPRKYVLVLSCVDYRLLDDLVRFLDHDNLANRYYHATFAGASLGLSGRLPDHPLGTFSNWRQAFIDHVRATVALTGGRLSDVYIVHHEDCGAFRLFVDGFEGMSAERQREVNREFADALLTDLRARFCDTYNAPVKVGHPEVVQEHPPAIHTFFMDLRGKVERFNSYLPTAGGRCPLYHCPCQPLPEPEDETEPSAEAKAPRAKKPGR